ncbi:hypothetical protein IIC68_02335 [archaeon]|nr:hypothetical protein [archaeon]
MDNTTIQVNKKTVSVLNRIKEKYGVSSYDKAILEMAKKEIKIPKSMFGSHPNLKSFKRDEDDFHDL